MTLVLKSEAGHIWTYKSWGDVQYMTMAYVTDFDGFFET